MNKASLIPDHIRIKVKEADEAPRKILDLCCQQLVNPNDVILKEISGRLGTMAQILRSSLNNMMWDFAERELRPHVSAKEHDALRWSHDFPIESTNKNFRYSKSRLLRHIKKLSPIVYDYLESIQPYHYQYNLLWALKLLSNDATHTIPVKVLQPNISSVVFAHGGQPKIIGNNVMIPFDKNNPVILSIPCFIEAMDMFVSADGKWQVFMIDLNIADPKHSVTGFINQATPLISGIIEGFYSHVPNAG